MTRARLSKIQVGSCPNTKIAIYVTNAQAECMENEVFGRPYRRGKEDQIRWYMVLKERGQTVDTRDVSRTIDTLFQKGWLRQAEDSATPVAQVTEAGRRALNLFREQIPSMQSVPLRKGAITDHT